jgi:proteic killer suppression protein
MFPNWEPVDRSRCKPIMIKSFADDDTESVYHGIVPKRFPGEMLNRALRKLRMIDLAGNLNDLRIPPGNRLEALKGDRAGEHSIRINDQWRICFVWKDGDAYRVEISKHYGN